MFAPEFPSIQELRFFIKNQKCQPHGGGSPKSVGFILLRPSMSVQYLILIHPIVLEILVYYYLGFFALFHQLHGERERERERERENKGPSAESRMVEL